jgi:hypothetical protein
MSEFYWALAIGAIGALLGLFFSLNGFAEPIKPTDLKNSARVRNLLWLVTGAVGVILADWKRLAGSAPEAGFLLVSYLLGAITGAILGLLVIVLFLALSIRHANRQRNGLDQLPYRLIIDYLHHGYGHFQQMWAKHEEARSIRQAQIDQEVQRALQQALRRERLARMERDASVQDVIAALVHGIAAVLAEPDPERRRERQNEVIDAILDGLKVAVLNQVRSDFEGLRIRVNHMNFIPIVDTTEEQRTAALFRFGDEDRYTGLLVLHRAAGGSALETVVLPVDGRVSDRGTLLPGAPEAFVLGKAAIINSRSIRCGHGINRATQAAIRKFFEAVDFESVASIPISSKSGPMGVINIESNRCDLLGEGEEIGKAVCTTLQPFAALLSRVL